MPRARSHRIAVGSSLVAWAARLLMLGPALAMAQAPGIEHAVKATYLYKFAPFVEWPAGAFRSPSDPLVICIVGTDALGNLADEAATGQTVAGRRVAVVHLAAPARDSDCHIMYVSVSLRDSARAEVLNRVRGTPILTVTDSAREARTRGIINFVVQNDRVRFEIDLDAAAENHLMISSKLLSLAASVRQRQ